jgi:hypothetical protein
MPHFVPHHEQDLAAVELREQGVPKDDPLRLPDPLDVGVDRPGLCAHVDLEDPPPVDPGAVGQGEDLGLQGLVAHRPEFVEQGIDQDRPGRHQQESDRQIPRRHGERPAPGQAVQVSH